MKKVKPPVQNLLQQLQRDLPAGVVAPSRWLSSLGISPQLARKYVANGWLVPLAYGAYAWRGRTDSALPVVDWQGVVLSLQRLEQQAVHVGGVSALNLQGLAHYLPLGGETHIQLWPHARTFSRAGLPRWVALVTEKGFVPQSFILNKALFGAECGDAGLHELPTRVREWGLLVSAPERAILEVLCQVGEDEASFTHAVELFEGMTTGRPPVVQQLLEQCSSIKTKRLFLYLASRLDYPWLKGIDVSSVDLGSSVMPITKGGRFNRQFNITVPRGLDAQSF